MLVFAAAQLLPGDIGRTVLGPFADEASVRALNHELGVDRPFYVQYADWISHFVRGDLGTSQEYKVSVWSLLSDSLVNSLKLAAVAFVLLVPLSLFGGVVAALTRGRFADRAITLTSISLSTVPEFVTAIILLLVLGIWLG